jgi:hypothetical protein
MAAQLAVKRGFQGKISESKGTSKGTQKVRERNSR